jgi:F-type H+-transporting ATPase subunit b
MSLESLALYSQFVGAIVFLIVAIWLFRKFVSPALAKYEAAQNAVLAEAEARREKMKADVSAARGEVETASRDASSIEQRATADAAAEHDRIVAAAKDDAARIVRNAEGELDRARMSARAALREELVRKALESARATASARVDAQTNSRLVAATVDNVERERAGAGI